MKAARNKCRVPHNPAEGVSVLRRHEKMTLIQAFFCQAMACYYPHLTMDTVHVSNTPIRGKVAGRPAVREMNRSSRLSASAHTSSRRVA